MRIRTRRDAGWDAALARIQTYIDLVVVKMRCGHKQCRDALDLMRMRILRVRPFLKAGVVLLKSIAVHGIVEKVREVRVQVEQRSPEEAIHLERIAVGEGLAVVARKCSQLHAPAIGGVHVTKSIKQASAYKIEWNLPGRIEVVPAEDEAQAPLLDAAQRFP